MGAVSSQPVTRVSAPRGRSSGARHAGITVSDLDRSLEFYCGLLGLELLWRRLYEEREIAEIVGVPEATAFDIAMLRVPGSDVEVELLEYQGCERRSGSARPVRLRHRALRALRRATSSALYADLAGRGVAFRSDGPVEMSAGPNARRQEPLLARPGRLRHRVHASGRPTVSTVTEHARSRSTGRWR